MFEPVSELAEINPALSAELPQRVDALVSFIPMGDVSASGQWVDRRTKPLAEVSSGFTPFQEEDVLFAKITPCMENGKGAHVAGLENGVGFGSTEFHVLRARNGNASRYVFHLCQSAGLRLKAESSMIGSAGQKRVPAGFFHKHQVFAPVPVEQQLIARIVDTLDTQIQKTEALIAKLEKVKEGLLHDLLTRGIDENGQLRPSPEQAPELYKESPLGQIPKSWSISTVGEVADPLVGPAFESSRFTGASQGVRLLRGLNVTRGRIRWDESKTERWPSTDRSVSRYALRKGDIVVGMDGALVGRNKAMLTDEDIPSLLVQRVVRLRANHADCTYLYMNICSPRFLAHIDNVKTHTAIPHITSGNVCEFLVPLPSPQEVEAITMAYKSLEEKARSSRSQLSKLTAYKFGLMDDLLTGRVRVTSLLDKAQAT